MNYYFKCYLLVKDLECMRKKFSDFIINIEFNYPIIIFIIFSKKQILYCIIKINKNYNYYY